MASQINEVNEIKVPKRILNTLLASLTAGVVPRSGAPYIAIGRKEEINCDPKDKSFCYCSSKSWFSPFFPLGPPTLFNPTCPGSRGTPGLQDPIQKGLS